MKQLLEALTEEMGKAFAAAGYDAAMGKVGVSARPDLAEYQCNGAMAGAKQYHKAPFMIAEDVAAKLQDSAIFEDVAGNDRIGQIRDAAPGAAKNRGS